MYKGQPLFGKHNSWFVDEDGVTRNRWTGETGDELVERQRASLRSLEEAGAGRGQVAGALRHSLRNA